MITTARRHTPTSTCTTTAPATVRSPRRAPSAATPLSCWPRCRACRAHPASTSGTMGYGKMEGEADDRDHRLHDRARQRRRPGLPPGVVRHEAHHADHLRRHERAAPARLLRQPGPRQPDQHRRRRVPTATSTARRPAPSRCARPTSAGRPAPTRSSAPRSTASSLGPSSRSRSDADKIYPGLARGSSRLTSQAPGSVHVVGRRGDRELHDDGGAVPRARTRSAATHR